MLIWGLNFIAVKIQGTEAALEVSLFYRSLIAFVLFYMLLKLKRLPLRKAHTNYGTIIGFGICNFAVSYLLLYYGTIYSTAALVTLIFSLKAITTPIFLRIVFKTPLQNKIYIGGALGLLSVVIILYPDLHTISSSFLLGIGLAAVGTIVTSIGDVFPIIITKKISIRCVPIQSVCLSQRLAYLFLRLRRRRILYFLPHFITGEGCCI